MKRIFAVALVVLSLGLVVRPASAQGQKASDEPTEFVVNKDLAKAGKGVWAAKGCAGCHTIGKGRLAAPDLNGLFARRGQDWVKHWLKDPDAMLASDETAKALLVEYKLKMPNLKLTDDEITAVMNYIASENKPGKK